MKTNKINKLFLVALLAGVSLFTATLPVSAAPQDGCDPNSTLGKAFGCDSVLSNGFESQSAIATFLKILLGVSLLMVAASLMWKGRKALQAAETSKDRTEKAVPILVSHGLAMVLILVVLPFTNAISGTLVGSNPIDDVGNTCKGFRSGGTTQEIGVIKNGKCMSTIDENVELIGA